MKLNYFVLLLIVLLNLRGISYQTDINKADVFTEITNSNFSEKEITGNNDSLLFSKLQQMNFNFKETEKGKLIYHCQINLTEEEKTTLNIKEDLVTLPFIVYIPQNYDFTRETPLLVYLHGGISRPETEDVGKWNLEDEVFFEEINNRGWIGLFPTGKVGFTWWDDTNIFAIITIIRDLKFKYNIDDNRVYMTGISDGGSGSFGFAALNPNQFASFYPIIGCAAVHSSSRGEAFAPKNLTNRFIYAVNNDGDPLYPSEYMNHLNKILFDNGADIFYKEYYGYGHEFPYYAQEVPVMADYMENHPRNPFPARIYWETYKDAYGRCDWLKITGVDSLKTKKAWQKTFSHRCLTKRLIFGFVPARAIDEQGCLVESVNAESISEKMGLQPGDIILKIDDTVILNDDSLWVAKNKLKPLKEFSFQIVRNEKPISLTGVFENYLDYEAFPYNSPSGAAQASYFNNIFFIETSAISHVSLYLSDEMVNRNNPVQVFINGKMVCNKIIAADFDFALQEMRKTGDRKAIWFNKLDFEINE